MKNLATLSNSKIITLDAETNGLRGNAFAIGAVLMENGKEVKRIKLRMPDKYVTCEFVIDNVLPEMGEIPVTHTLTKEMQKEIAEANLSSAEEFAKEEELIRNAMFADFADWYYANKENATVLYHMGHVVESKVFQDLFKMGLMEEFDGPYLPIEVAEYLRMAGESADSVDDYMNKYGLEKPAGSTHDPLYDCIVAYKVFYHICNN